MDGPGHLTVVPPYLEAPRRRAPGALIRGLRWICFLTFLASLVLVAPSQFPHQGGTAESLARDVRAGRTSSVSIRNGDSASTDSVTFRWRSGLLAWHEGSESWGAGTGRTRLRAIVDQASRESGHDVAWTTYGGHRVVFLALGDAGLWPPLVLVTALLWLAVFLGMLVTPEHPYANRWAWFWLFLIGAVGPLLLLWKEPEPLRLRFWRHAEPYQWRQTPLTGGIGFAYAVGWAIVLAVGGTLLQWAASR